MTILADAVILSWPEEAQFGALWPALAVLGSSLAWGVDNDLTSKVSLVDATWVAMSRTGCGQAPHQPLRRLRRRGRDAVRARTSQQPNPLVGRVRHQIQTALAAPLPVSVARHPIAVAAPCCRASERTSR